MPGDAIQKLIAASSLGDATVRCLDARCIPCPGCDAPAGSYCVRWDGRRERPYRPAHLHKVRVDSFEAAKSRAAAAKTTPLDDVETVAIRAGGHVCKRCRRYVDAFGFGCAC